MRGVTENDYIGLVEEKLALLLHYVSKGAMFKNLKLELKVRKKCPKNGGRVGLFQEFKRKIMGSVTGYDYIGLVEEKQALLLRQVSKGAMFKNLKLELKI